MSSRPVLDSPPVVVPAPPRLKRSSSTVSLASLPTPPRTIHKRKRSSSKASSFVDSADDSDGSISSKAVTSKRRKIKDSAKEDDAQEEAFWLDKDDVPVPKPAAVEAKLPSPTRSASPEVPTTSYRPAKTGLVSPPPSRRQPARKVKHLSTPKASTSKPAKKKGKGKDGKRMPIRDSPNNPFLDKDDSSLRMKTPPRRTAPAEEKRTMTYVFRGQKQEMANPMFGYKASENSLLPPEHPDFSPDLACPPKLLFPKAHRKRQQPSRLLLRRSPSPASGDDSDNEDAVLGKKLTPMGKLTVVGERRETRSSPSRIDPQSGSKHPAGN